MRARLEKMRLERLSMQRAPPPAAKTDRVHIRWADSCGTSLTHLSTDPVAFPSSPATPSILKQV